MASSFLARDACDGERACYRQGAIFGGFVPRLLTWFARDYDLGFGIPMLLGTCVGAAPLVIAPLLGAQPSTPSSNPTTAFDGTYVGVSAENSSRGNTLAGGRGRPQDYAGGRSWSGFGAFHIFGQPAGALEGGA